MEKVDKVARGRASIRESFDFVANQTMLGDCAAKWPRTAAELGIPRQPDIQDRAEGGDRFKLKMPFLTQVSPSFRINFC